MNTICRTVINPEKTAFQLLGGAALSYDELEDASLRTANWFRSLGLKRGDHIAFMLENRCELVSLCWAAQRCGLYYTLIASHLKADEAAYITDNCDAILVATSPRFADMWRGLKTRLDRVRHWVNVEGEQDGFLSLEANAENYPSTPSEEEYEGSSMLYSSGTTGKPKGVIRPTNATPFGQERLSPIYQDYYGMDETTVYLSPAPLYHAAPLRCVMAIHRIGGTVLAMEKFDAERMLAAVERYQVTHVQLVPTMMRRLVDLPDNIREKYDLSSLKIIVHAAAPCPIDLKQTAINWFGPIVCEYYGSTEGVGVTYITSEEWLSRKGSVGRAIIGEPHIIGKDGSELPAGEVGEIYFANGPAFEYYNDPEKTAAAANAQGWVTLGDIGSLDEDGYLYLTDRKSFTINSGGVNIYPKEIEDILRAHEDVADVAVISAPNREFGEEVKAVVQLRRPSTDPDATEKDLIAHCRTHISHVKCPKSVDFVDQLPHSDAGKLLKGELKKRYWKEDGLACQ